MEVSITFKLLDKHLTVDGERIEVCGLAEFHVCPAKVGIGRMALHLLYMLSDGKPIVGFAGDDVVEFYRKCGWHVRYSFDPTAKAMISSVDFDDEEGSSLIEMDDADVLEGW